MPSLDSDNCLGTPPLQRADSSRDKGSGSSCLGNTGDLTLAPAPSALPSKELTLRKRPLPSPSPAELPPVIDADLVSGVDGVKQSQPTGFLGAVLITLPACSSSAPQKLVLCRRVS